MRIIVFIFIIIAGIPLINLAQNIPNGNFETWTYNSSGMPQPQFWETQNEPEIIYVEPLPGYSENYAACLNVQWDYLLKKYCGATLKSEFKLSEPQKYLNLSGYYSGRSENIDTLIIEVILLFKNEMIGYGAIKILDNSNNWENFNVPIQYYSEGIPDRASISISINPNKGGHSLSSYCIDDLLLANLWPLPRNIANNAQRI